MTQIAWWVAPTGIAVCMVGCHSLLGLDELEMVDVVGGQGGATTSSSEGGTATGTTAAGGEAGVAGVGGVGGVGGPAGGQGGNAGGQGGGDGGGSCEEGGASGSGAPYAHTIAIDGDLDFDTSDEQFITSSTTPNVYTAYFSWDADYFYYGMRGVDVASDNASFWLLAYFGGVGGTRNGQVYGTEQPTLPFEARYHVRWRADNGLTSAQSAAGTWGPLAWDFTDDVYQTGDFVELRIPLADLGSPPIVRVHLSMINETSGWSYAATPADSFVDGDDPDYSRYFAFDLSSPRAPTNYPALGGPPRVWINELHYANTGGDLGEGVELAGPAGIVLDGWHLLAYDGATGNVYAERALCGELPNEQANKGTLWFGLSGDTLQNGGPDAVALVDDAGQLVQWLSYQGTFFAQDGAAFGLISTDIGVAEADATTAPGYSLQLTGTGTSYASFAWGGPVAASPGAMNAGQTFQ